MRSVSKIETAIKKLSVAEQKLIARHLGERLEEKTQAFDCADGDEGIPFLV